jgi:hypothetical protein
MKQLWLNSLRHEHDFGKRLWSKAILEAIVEIGKFESEDCAVTEERKFESEKLGSDSKT